MQKVDEKLGRVVRPKSPRISITLIVVIVVVALILAAFSYSTGFFGVLRRSSNQSSATIDAYVHFSQTSTALSYSPLLLNPQSVQTRDLSNVTITLLSPMPDSLNHVGGVNMVGLNQSDNPYEVVLLNETGSSSTANTPLGYPIEGSLSPVFANIIKEWKGVIGHKTQQAS